MEICLEVCAVSRQVILRCQWLLSDGGTEHHSRPNLGRHPSVGGLSLDTQSLPVQKIIHIRGLNPAPNSGPNPRFSDHKVVIQSFFLSAQLIFKS